MSLFSTPSAANKTIRARSARPCAVFRRAAKLPSSPRSLSVKSIATALLPIANPPQSHRAESHIFFNQDTSAALREPQPGVTTRMGGLDQAAAWRDHDPLKRGLLDRRGESVWRPDWSRERAPARKRGAALKTSAPGVRAPPTGGSSSDCDDRAVEKLYHRIDLVEVFGHREAGDLRPEGLKPRRADGQVDAFALDLRGLGNGTLDLAKRRVVIAKPAPRAFALHERIADRQTNARSFEHDAAGVVLFLHVQDGGLDFVELEPLAKHIDQIKLAAEDAPGRADRERSSLIVDDGRVPALDDCFEAARRRLVALKIL